MFSATSKSHDGAAMMQSQAHADVGGKAISMSEAIAIDAIAPGNQKSMVK